MEEKIKYNWIVTLTVIFLFIGYIFNLVLLARAKFTINGESIPENAKLPAAILGTAFTFLIGFLYCFWLATMKPTPALFLLSFVFVLFVTYIAGLILGVSLGSNHIWQPTSLTIPPSTS